MTVMRWMCCVFGGRVLMRCVCDWSHFVMMTICGFRSSWTGGGAEVSGAGGHWEPGEIRTSSTAVWQLNTQHHSHAIILHIINTHTHTHRVTFVEFLKKLILSSSTRDHTSCGWLHLDVILLILKCFHFKVCTNVQKCLIEVKPNGLINDFWTLIFVSSSNVNKCYIQI